MAKRALLFPKLHELNFIKILKYNALDMKSFCIKFYIMYF